MRESFSINKNVSIENLNAYLSLKLTFSILFLTFSSDAFVRKNEILYVMEKISNRST